MMLQRNLLYTGVTRGKRLVILVGEKRAVAIAVKGTTADGAGPSYRSGWRHRRRWPVTDKALPGRMVLATTHTELVAKLAASADVSEHDAGAVVSTVLKTIGEALAQGDRIELRGFGAFSVRQREAREARNPRTGEAVQVPAKMSVHFKAGRQLHKILNGDPDTLAVLRDRREEQCRRRDERRGQLRLL